VVREFARHDEGKGPTHFRVGNFFKIYRFLKLKRKRVIHKKKIYRFLD